MFLTYKKLESRAAELADYRYRDVMILNNFWIKEDVQNKVNPEIPEDFSEWESVQSGARWQGRDKYLWLYLDVEIPAKWAEKRVVGIFDFGMTGSGNNSGFESLLYVNGEPYQAVDTNHKEVFLKEEMCGRKVSLLFRLWSGREGGGIPTEMEHTIKPACLGWLDEKTDDLFYMSNMIVQAIECMDENSSIRHDLQINLEKAFHIIDWSYPGSEEFYDSIARADDFLNEKIDCMDKNSDITIYAVGHTHIDTAWLWTLKNTREKCSRSFSTVLRLMEMFPEFYFLHTQPQQYEYMKEDFPEMYDKIKARIAEGRWEADGAMWVEADCNLTSGESLTRQILLGSKFFQDEFGKDIHFLWLPDVFGYSWALPQILKKAGIDMFMTTKISWNQYNRMPHDTFMWKGIDGSEVLTHFITTPPKNSLPGSWFYVYNGQLFPKTVQGAWNNYSEKDINRELIISYGFGDGGGGVTRDMLENRRRLDRIPGLPNVKCSTAGEYFERLKATINNTDQHVSTWDGELYLEYHRGTYTSHAYNKRMNRKMELLYREAEWFTVMRALMMNGNMDVAEQEKLTQGWKCLLTNQFHDIIPGSSIYDVYEDCKKDYAWIEQVGQEVEDGFLQEIAEQKDNVYTVVNPNNFVMNSTVLLLGAVEATAQLSDGTKVPAQKTVDGLLIYLKNVAPMSFTQIIVSSEKENSMSAFKVSQNEVETPYYIIQFNECGQMVRLYDKEFEREVLPKGQRGNVLQVFEDKPLNHDAWDIDIFYQDKMREITELQVFEIVENGPVQLTVHMEWKYMSSFIYQDMILYAEDRRIDYVTKVDCHEQHQLLKAAFPVDIRTTYGTFDVQYGNVRRPNHWNTSWDMAKFETVAHRFADLSEHNYGVSLLNDCKYGHDVKDNVLRITLIKTATHPDHLQDQGEHFFTYSLLPHGGDIIEGRTIQEACALNQPLHAIAGSIKLPFESFISFDKECVELDAVKKTEDGKYVLIRFHDFTGGSNKLYVYPGFAYRKFCLSDLRERPIEEWKEAEEIKLTVKPFEIVTLLFEI